MLEKIISKIYSFFIRPKISDHRKKMIEPNGILITAKGDKVVDDSTTFTINLSVKQAVQLEAFLKYVDSNLTVHNEDIMYGMARTIRDYLDELWQDIKYAPSDDIIDILYKDGSKCRGRCVQIGECKGKKKHYFVPEDATTAEALVMIQNNDLPTHWRKKTYEFINCRRVKPEVSLINNGEKNEIK